MTRLGIISCALPSSAPLGMALIFMFRNGRWDWFGFLFGACCSLGMFPLFLYFHKTQQARHQDEIARNEGIRRALEKAASEDERTA